MGFSSWSSATYTAATERYASQNIDELFATRQMKKTYDPKVVNVRESRDSDTHPESTAVIVGLDVTGSMGKIAEDMAKSKLGILVDGILETKPVTDPHVMMMGIGDIVYDSAPLQVTQFEADIKIAEQLTDLWLEGGGGGNNYESYDLPWAFAAYKTSIDCYEKRGIKGYLFTIGDECPPTYTKTEHVKSELGIEDGFEQGYDPKAALELAQEKYNVFHIIVEQGYYAARHLSTVVSKWNDLLGKRAIRLKDANYVAEVILSVMRVNEGEDPDDVINEWQDEGARSAVKYALFPPS